MSTSGVCGEYMQCADILYMSRGDRVLWGRETNSVYLFRETFIGDSQINKDAECNRTPSVSRRLPWSGFGGPCAFPLPPGSIPAMALPLQALLCMEV